MSAATLSQAAPQRGPGRRRRVRPAVCRWRCAAPAPRSGRPPRPPHSAPGGAAYAGGRGIATPFGTVYAGNLTPDARTGLGRWSPEDFWRALHHGLGRDGRRLVPAFPYTAYTLVSRADSLALWAYLRSLPPVAQANPPHALRFPFNTAPALAAWRVLYFSPGEYQPELAQAADWNRGAYLVRGLGHCAACHGARDPLGGLRDALLPGGGQLPGAGWYAPSLLSPHEAGVADWPLARITELLGTGHTAGASTLGPMAEVVLHSTQYLSAADLHAMAVYLQTLPGRAQASTAAPAPAALAEATQLAQGVQLYRQQCAACHGPQGQGAAGAYAALAGNRAVMLANPVNLVRLLLQGGFAPATAGHPRPYGMPPMLADDAELAAVRSHLRQAWGHQASAVSAQDVRRVRDAAR